jgi:hypothetical protein
MTVDVDCFDYVKIKIFVSVATGHGMIPESSQHHTNAAVKVVLMLGHQGIIPHGEICL